MAPARRPRTRGQGAPAGALLLLLLLRPAGGSGTSEALGALPATAPPEPRAPCAHRATCSPGQTSTPAAAGGKRPAFSGLRLDLQPSCGMSYEQDVTLRDPEAMARRWPWLVSVRANGTHICAGTLISFQWVLAVAHCLTQRNVYYSVQVGSPLMNETSQYASNISVLQVIVKSQYRARRYWSWIGRANDIGLLKLQLGVKYSKYVWPICLPGLDFEVKDRTLCSVMGWGSPKAHGIWPQSLSIQEKDVTIMNSNECDKFYHKFSNIPSLVRIITAQMMCGEDLDRTEFCYEQTGEPLTCPVEDTWYLVGMVSWGPGCNQGKAPPIYTRVSSHQEWIWDRLNRQPPAQPAPARVLLLALLLLLSLLARL
ncbi:probable threonine protease PRSS50 [Dasypus novemcinctus]|uniref:probable threonine protease PRSS50 n=1 Tax=Dasypus novemcinctus TaxID=9361 RepID=UPI00265E3F70|nr:probable threonine protease PRSS50 [Dasypus novemcinctus]